MRTLRLAWRNLWRNRRRTAITMGAVCLSTMVLLLADALMRGVMEGAIRNATDLGIGELQVHAPDYLARRSFYDAIPDAVATAARIRERGYDVAPRSYGYGLVAGGSKSAGALFQGVDPALEREAFRLDEHTIPGDFLGDAAEAKTVIGRKLARSLDVGIGDEIVVVVQAADGSLGNELFTVAGILESVGESMDRSAVLLHAEDFERLFVAGGRIHELAVHGHAAVPLEVLRGEVADAAPGLDVRTWRELLPMLSDMTQSIDAMMWIFFSVFFLAAGLGVLNTMLMATHERIREFGLLKALGTTPASIATEVAVEALFLAVLGSGLGVVLGSALAVWLSVHGIDTASFAGRTTIAGVAFDPIWRASLDWRALPGPVASLWLVCVLAALYPALLAARLDPVRAMRHT